LLPAGVVKIVGNFERGDAVLICDSNSHKIGVGLVAFNADDANSIVGKKSTEVRDILGFDGRYEMVHRDDMALDSE